MFFKNIASFDQLEKTTPLPDPILFGNSGDHVILSQLSMYQYQFSILETSTRYSDTPVAD